MTKNKIKNYFDFNTIVVSIMLLIYAFFSSSTPDKIGVAEAIIAFILVLVIVKNSFSKIFDIKMNLRIFGIFYIFFIYMLIVPTFTGIVIKMNDIINFFRDFIPFLYFFLPIFFIPFMRKEPKKWIYLLSGLLLIIGASFSIRHFVGAVQDFSTFGKVVIHGDKNYFPMDPSVIFGATFGILMGLELMFFSMKHTKNLKLIGLILVVLGVTAYLSILAIVVRAQIILVLFSVIIFILIRAKTQTWIIVLLFIIIASTFFSVFFLEGIFSDIFGLVMDKFNAVGLSGRDAEAMAVIKNSSKSIISLVFGEGWGGLISNPTGGGAMYRFVHNVNMYFLFKAGLFGFLFGSIFIFYFFYQVIVRLISCRKKHIVIVLISIFNSTVLNFILEPGYKMMPIGLIITLFYLILIKKNYKGKVCFE